MPRLDGTGPRGQGPKTGRGMGNCSRCALCPLATLSPEDRLKLLKEEKSVLEEEIAKLEKSK